MHNQTMKKFTATSGNESHTFFALDYSEARHIVINHFDCSKKWEVNANH